MTHIRKLVLVLCLGLLLLNSSKAQDYTTGNLVTTTDWAGTRAINNDIISQCCNGGPGPGYNTDNNTIYFSWWTASATQALGINRAFENIGSGIKVTGYNYSWQVSNEGMHSGTLAANISLIGSNGNTLESYNYDYSRYIPGFETFSGTQKFSVDYGTPSLSSLNVTFTGKDNRYWAGYYGPQVRNVNLSLNYAFDTSKPPAPTTLPTVITNVDTISNTVESTGSNSTSGLPQEVINGTAPDVLANPTTSSTSTASSNPVSVSPVVEVTKDGGSRSSSGPSSLALSVVQKNKDAVKATEAQAVQKAQEQASNDAKSAQQQSQLAIETTQQATQTSVFQLVSNNTSSSSFSLVKQNTTYQPVQLQQQNSAVTTQQSFSIMEQRQEQRLQEAPQIPQQATSARTDPVKALTEPLFSLDNIPQETKLEAMRTSSKESELSSGVSIASIAIVPNGYSSYTNYQLLDAKFYTVKPIYQNQKVVDNVRVLRGLGSDQKHLQMVNDQYR